LKYTIVCILMLFLALGAKTLKKSDFDLDFPCTSGLSKTAGRSIPARSFIQNQFLEAALFEGCFFTLGTNQGLLESSLDDKCCITYGHPYAKTSYPFLKIQNAWGKLEACTDISIPQVRRTTDSVTYRYFLNDSIEFTFSLSLLPAAEGAGAMLAMNIANRSNAVQTVQPALIYDPGMGRFEPDAAAWVNGASLVQTEGQANGCSTLVFSEKSAGHTGLRCSLTPIAGTLETAVFGNWHKMEAAVASAYDTSTRLPFYDLAVKLLWQQRTIAPDSSIAVRLAIKLEPPDFGQQAFIRWDVPRFLTVETGALFPQTIDTRAYVDNLLAFPKNFRLFADLPFQVVFNQEVVDFSVNSMEAAYQTLRLLARENYQADTIVPLTLILAEGANEIDRVTTNLYVPQCPFSDTGLVVTIDSFFTNNAGEKIVTFSAQVESTTQALFNLGLEHVTLYENNARINPAYLGRDTSGGASAVDIVFVLDVTGSMSDNINDVKNNIIMFNDTLVNRGIDHRLGMVTFLDAVENIYQFTDNITQFKSYVDAQYAHGGGDGPENDLQALHIASGLNFRPEARKVFIWITDAPYHEMDWATTLDIGTVVNTLLAHDIMVYAVGEQANRDASAFNIYNPTGGKWFDIRGPFQDVLMDVANLRYSSKSMALYTGGVASSTVMSVRLSVHHAGLGGSGLLTLGGSAPLTAGKRPATSLTLSPNPSNPSTLITCSVNDRANGELSICDIRGRMVFNERFINRSGLFRVSWNGRSATGTALASGLYMVRLRVDVADKPPVFLNQKLVLAK